MSSKIPLTFINCGVIVTSIQNTKALTRNSRYPGYYREKMVGANLHGTNIEAASELWTEQRILSRLQRSSPVNVGSNIGEIPYWQSAEKSEIRW